ncbi:quinone oxidoreductase family protein [Pseudomonas fluorescens]|uniref:quinone oxidoreductase family protein n=1 Tax=Pseudomonas fluorescens TaxID=294 RepID=UPI001242B04E|nr:quinone oxidoreductase [Pseudomonas fluorescens]VVN43891.1 Quinone oxidoreductase 1 [Pseudomonas fluorescens]
MKAIMIKQHGGAEELYLQDLASPVPGPGEVLVDVVAAGVNFMDVGVRKGLYSISSLPKILGAEGAGRVTQIGEGVTRFKVGDRVAWFYIVGSYTEQLVASVDALVPIPEDISFEIAAGAMMQGLTAMNLTHATYKIRPGDTALVHSAAGGVGLMLTQMIKLLGGNVIGRVSTQEKAELARKAGADHVIIASEEGFSQQVMSLTNGKGVNVVYDGAGADTFNESQASLDYYGVLAYYGQTIKSLPPIDLTHLPKSILVSFPVVHHLVRTYDKLSTHSHQLFTWIQKGLISVNIGQRYPLAAAAQAHRDLENRLTLGKSLLIP